MNELHSPSNQHPGPDSCCIHKPYSVDVPALDCIVNDSNLLHNQSYTWMELIQFKKS
jgi:hypothetical protein